MSKFGIGIAVVVLTTLLSSAAPAGVRLHHRPRHPTEDGWEVGITGPSAGDGARRCRARLPGARARRRSGRGHRRTTSTASGPRAPAHLHPRPRVLRPESGCSLLPAGPQVGRDRIDLRATDLNAPIPLAAASFDGAICLDAVLHLRDRGAFFGEVARLLRTGARFLLTDAAIVTAPLSSLKSC